MIAWIRRTIAQIFGQRWVRFGIVGGISTVVYWVCGVAFQHWGLLPVLVGNGVAYLVGFCASYVGHRLWTFQSTGSVRSELPKFAATQAFGLSLNTAIIAVLMRWGLLYTLSMVIATVLVPGAVYLISKFWVFRETSRLADAARSTSSNPEVRP